MVSANREMAVYCFDTLVAHYTSDQVPPPAFDEGQHPLFVTWKKAVNGCEPRLRGCIGTLEARAIVNGFRDYALTSALRDRRFPPIQAKELPYLECTVSILTDYESANHYLDWEVGKHGLIIEFTDPDYNTRRSATYLPEVAAHEEFKWDDVKVDKHRENYLGHSIMAPVGRWQKGKDLHWYARDKKAAASEAEKAKEEVKRIKEEEEQAMREALGLAPKRASRAQGNKLDKYEYAELTKRGSTAEDLGGGHAEAAQVQGLGLYKGHKMWAQTVSAPNEMTEEHPTPENRVPEGPAPPVIPEEASDDDDAKKKRRREERKEEKERRQSRHEKRSYDSEERHSKHEKKRSRDLQDKHKHRREKERRRHDSDSD